MLFRHFFYLDSITNLFGPSFLVFYALVLSKADTNPPHTCFAHFTNGGRIEWFSVFSDPGHFDNNDDDNDESEETGGGPGIVKAYVGVKEFIDGNIT